MKELIFVTHNAHKADEVKAIINDTFKIKNLSEINFFEEIPETGNTFQDNALQKAKYLHDKIKCNCFADDSGLSVDALHGEPGVLSARYAGEPSNSQRNTEKLLKSNIKWLGFKEILSGMYYSLMYVKIPSTFA